MPPTRASQRQIGLVAVLSADSGPHGSTGGSFTIAPSDLILAVPEAGCYEWDIHVPAKMSATGFSTGVQLIPTASGGATLDQVAGDIAGDVLNNAGKSDILFALSGGLMAATASAYRSASSTGFMVRFWGKIRIATAGNIQVRFQSNSPDARTVTYQKGGSLTLIRKL